jgi:hypothetical protein
MTRPRLEADERLPALFEPHTILPEQYFTRLHRGALWSGEQRLMAAILEDAVAVSSKPVPPKTSKARHVLRETLRWLRSNDRTWTFSFLRICETLDLDPSAIRRGIRVLRGEEPSEHARASRVAELVRTPERASEDMSSARHAAVG